MMFLKKLKILLLSVFLVLCHELIYAQQPESYSYLIECFKNGKIDTATIEIGGMDGDIKMTSVSSDKEETGLTYYTVPKNIQNKPSLELAEIAAMAHIERWKNNSSVVKKEKFKVNDAAVIDLRLHMIIENIYMQVIVINDGSKIYEIMCFRDKNDNRHFDALTRKILKKACL